MATYKLTSGNDVFVGTGGKDKFDGLVSGQTGGVDKLSGGGGDDTFTFDGWGNLYPRGGRSRIDGGEGMDTLIISGSGLGYADYKNIENLVLDGFSRVVTSVPQWNSFSSISGGSEIWSLFEFVVIGKGGKIDFSSRIAVIDMNCDATGATSGVDLTGTAGADTLKGSNFSDVLRGGAGDDTFNLFGYQEVIDDNGVISSKPMPNAFDRVYGGEGNDAFRVSGGKCLIDGGDGTDTVYAERIAGAQFKNIEVLVLGAQNSMSVAQLSEVKTVQYSYTGQAEFLFSGRGGIVDFSSVLGEDGSVFIEDAGMTSGLTVTATGNDDAIEGSRFGDVINAGKGQDEIKGNGGSDTIRAGAGNDSIYLGTGPKSRVDGGSGYDKVFLQGTRESVLDIGDTVFGHVEALECSGAVRMTLHQLLSFRSVNIDDTYVAYDSEGRPSGPGIQLHGAGGKLDLPKLMTDFRGPILVIEDAGLTSAVDVTGTVEDDRIEGSAFADAIRGEGGEDWIKGGAGRDRLEGGTSNDTLDGGTGIDWMAGGSGDDTYVVDSRHDTFVEKANGGFDTVVVNRNFSLKKHKYFEALQLSGSRILQGMGDDADNVLVGNGAGSTLKGLGGRDTLYGWTGDHLVGGDGEDYFAFVTAPGPKAGVVFIDDFGDDDFIVLGTKAFRVADDQYLLERRFKDLAEGKVDASDRILYDPRKGDLFYDRDGSGHRYDAIKFAHLNHRPSLEAEDIFGF